MEYFQADRGFRGRYPAGEWTDRRCDSEGDEVEGSGELNEGIVAEGSACKSSGRQALVGQVVSQENVGSVRASAP